MPYVYAYFNDNLPTPYDTLFKDYREYSDTYKEWNLSVLWFHMSQGTTITITWDIDDIKTTEYDTVILYDDDIDINVANMMTIGTYSYASSALQTKHFKILCSSLNEPPEKPTISGKSRGKADTDYEYTFISTDPEEEEISYYIDWGDNSNTGWTITLPSGDYYRSSHTWSDKGDYIIKSKAKDINGAESDWTIFEVSMPKSKSINIILFLQKLFQRFPIIEKILNQLP